MRCISFTDNLLLFDPVCRETEKSSMSLNNDVDVKYIKLMFSRTVSQFLNIRFWWLVITGFGITTESRLPQNRCSLPLYHSPTIRPHSHNLWLQPEKTLSAPGRLNECHCEDIKWMGQSSSTDLKKLDHVEFGVGLLLFSRSSAEQFCRVDLVPVVVFALLENNRSKQTHWKWPEQLEPE